MTNNIKKNLKNFLNVLIKNKFIVLVLSLIFINIFYHFFQCVNYTIYSLDDSSLFLFNNAFYNAISLKPERFFLNSAHNFRVCFQDNICPAIVLFLPLYFVHTTYYTIFFFQILLVSLGALPVYLIAKDKLNSKIIAFLVAISYFFLPLTLMLYDTFFNSISFSVPFLLFMFYFWEKKNFKFFTLFVILSFLTKEDVSLVLILFGIYILLKGEKKKWALAPLLAGTFSFIFFMTLYLNGFLIDVFWVNFGMSFKQLIGSFINNPIEFFSRNLLNNKNSLYLISLFSSFLFLPIIAPEILFISLPKLFENFIKVYPTAPSMNVIFLPILMYGTIISLLRIKNLLNKKISQNNINIILIGILCLLIVNGIIFIGTEYFENKKTNLTQVNSEEHINYLCKEKPPATYYEIKKELIKFDEMIPRNASVASDASVILIFSNRENVFLLKEYKRAYEDPEFIIINEFLSNCLKKENNINFEEAVTQTGKLDEYKLQASKINVTNYLKNYEIMEKKVGFILLKKIHN